MKHKNIFGIIAIALTVICAMPVAAQTDTSGRGRVEIIKKTHDSSEDQRDTFEFKFRFSSPYDSSHPRKVQGIESSGNFNIGFANIYKPAMLIGPMPPYSNMPELNNGKSIHVALENNWGFNLIKGKLRLWLGLRYDITNYRFSDADTRLVGGNNYFKTSMDTNNNSIKSKVVTNYIGVPIALGFQSNRYSVEEGFFIRAGVNAGYRVRAHSKVKLENGNKDKEFDDFNFNDFAVSPFVYVGYNSIGLYARYTATPLFKENQGEEAYAVQFGLIFQ